MRKSEVLFPLEREFMIDLSERELADFKKKRDEFAALVRRGAAVTGEGGVFGYYMELVRAKSRENGHTAALFAERYVMPEDARERREEALKELRRWLRATVGMRTKWGRKERSWSKVDKYVREVDTVREVELYSVLMMIERLGAWEGWG